MGKEVHVWKRILPYPIGTRVTIVRDTISSKAKEGNHSYVERTGTIAGYCGEEDKKYLFETKSFPRTILKEIMYLVILDKDSVELIFRDDELEAVTDGK